MKNIVTIGGGSGQSELLYDLKNHDLNITAIVSMIDDGGSTGQLRDQLGVLPPGDVRRCIAALAQSNLDFAEALNVRFDNGDMKGHTLGNILLAGLERQSDFNKAVEVVSELVNVAGRVVPISLEQSTLYARLTDGTEVEGETNIDIPKHDSIAPIETVWLDPVPEATPAAIEAIKGADVVVYSIGDLYTSIVPNFLVNGITEAIAESSATFVYACNQTTKASETAGFDATRYVEVLEQYSGRSLDYIICNTASESDVADRVQYNEKELVNHGVKVITADVASDDGASVSGKKMAATIAALCEQLS